MTECFGDFLRIYMCANVIVHIYWLNEIKLKKIKFKIRIRNFETLQLLKLKRLNK